MTKKKMLKVCQVISVARCREDQRKVLKGLGLNRLHTLRELEDTPSIRGMIRKVSHLVRVQE